MSSNKSRPSNGHWQTSLAEASLASIKQLPATKVIISAEELLQTLYQMTGLSENFILKKSQNEIQQDYPVVHLATYGKFGGAYSSTFLQAFNKCISLEELEKIIRSKKEQIELFTLSACQTTAGDNRATLGFAGLAVRTGVKNFLATLWAANDADVLPLIREFWHC